MQPLQLTLRPAGLADADACQRLSAAVGWPHRREDWEFALSLGQGFTLSIEDAVVGVGLWWGFGATHATLGTIIVAPDRQGQGIGTTLMKAALAELRRLGGAGCVVLGSPGYYGRFGFKAHAGLVLPGVPQEYFQAIAFGGKMPAGDVRYHQAFDATE